MSADDDLDPGRESVFAHGRLAYLEIPALDIARSAAFYEAVFAWQVEPPSSGFTAPGLIGRWVTERPAVAPGAGPLAWINVDSLDESIERAAANGGELINPPAPDGPVRWLATIRDPAGNAVGIVEHHRP